jgi:hypothetical protein
MSFGFTVVLDHNRVIALFLLTTTVTAVLLNLGCLPLLHHR